MPNIPKQTNTADQRVFPIEGVLNARHFNGLCQQTPNLKNSHPSLIRAATLAKITRNGLEAMQEKNITTIVDLRSIGEYKHSPTPDFIHQNFKVIEAPVIDITGPPDKNMTDQSYPGHISLYRSILTKGSFAFRILFETINDNIGGVLFHCTVGKDRTGLAAALLLDLGGASDTAIIEDYMASEEQLSPIMTTQILKLIEYGIRKEDAVIMMQSPPEVMKVTLTWIREQWGSAEGYLQSIGVSSEAITNIQNRLQS